MRLIFFLICFGLVIVAPFWVYVPVVLVGVVVFPFFVEAIILGALVDVLYGDGRFLFGFTFTLLSAVVVYFAVPLREHLRFNA